MKIVQRLRSAWQNDSFYMQTTSKNAAGIFEAGVVGYIASRITGIISPRDGAIYSIANRVSDIFVEFIENKFLKGPFMYNEGPFMYNEGIEESLRWIIKMGLNTCFSRSICSLTRVRGSEIFGFNKATMGFICVGIAIDEVLKMTFKAFFPSSEVEGAS